MSQGHQLLEIRRAERSLQDPSARLPLQRVIRLQVRVLGHRLMAKAPDRTQRW
ncbi:hypothetical protein [Roseibium sp.]|uniref:hypothetical protein n=1 Tax=Roseibium sp. TaxID=1936156 RepID=UPI003A981068